MGKATKDKDTLNKTRESATTIANLLDIGELPLEYEVNENKYIETNITQDIIIKAIIAVSIVLAIALVVLVIRYRLTGLLSVISYIGFVATYLLVIRYTNTMISICSMAGILLVLILDYVYKFDLLKNIKNNKNEQILKNINNTNINWLIKIIPIAIISIVFTLMKLVPLSGFGATLFWGVIVIVVYNIIITDELLKIKEDK